MRVRAPKRGPRAGQTWKSYSRAEARRVFPAGCEIKPSPHALALARHRAPVDLATCGTFRAVRYLRETISKKLAAWYGARPKIPFTDEKLDAVRKRIAWQVANAAMLPPTIYPARVHNIIDPGNVVRLVPNCRNCEHDADEHDPDGKCLGDVLDYGGPFDCGCAGYVEDVVTIDVNIVGSITP